MNDLEKTALKIIKKIEYLNISSITPDGKPWGSPVYTAYDNDLNYYWVSWKENQHSLNIKNNPNVFITLYDSTVPCSTGVGVYLEGSAKQITNPITLAKCLYTFYKRRNREPKDIKQFLTKYPRRLFMFTPTKGWINGESDIKGNFIDIKTEISLVKLRQLLR